jgi:outer membrane protein TolC
VLNYGRIKNNISIQQASFRELVANYQNTVLTANQEVEDALVAFLETQEQVASLSSSVQETRRALDLLLINFKAGETDFTGVFVLQADLVQKQDQLAAVQGEVVTSLISLYKALGGGWEVRCQGFRAQESMTAVPEMIKELPPPVLTPLLSYPVIIDSLPEPPEAQLGAGDERI